MASPSPERGVHARHGEVRGLSQDREDKAETKLRSPEDPKFEGLFGRMFDKGTSVGEEILEQLAHAMTAPVDPAPPEDQPDEDENTGTAEDPGISAGYTYLGQFIDHDITFDPASIHQKQKDRNALVDYRTPRFDLDNLYGRGPADQPYLYEHHGKSFVLGDPLTGNDHDPHACDLPRSPSNGRAIIGDPRNDENEIVSQLHAAMMRFHNVLVRERHKEEFEQVQKLVRWHYQWIVLHDFLPTIVNKETLASILPYGEKTRIPKHPPRLKFFNRSRWRHDVFMPIEFSVAAYRFGHAMIRHTYRLNTQTDRLPLRDLFGFQRPREGRAIDWSLFFGGAKDQPLNGPKRLQWAYKIDTSLVHPLGALPTRILPEDLPKAQRLHSLAWRDLIRGLEMKLPSGQAVAECMHYKALSDDKLKIGPATEAAAANNKSLVSISGAFKNKAPLWFYVLSEAQQHFRNNQTPIRLGPVGGRIVAEVIVGLMAADKTSVLHQKNFHPQIPVNGRFRMWDLLEFVRERSAH